MNGNHVWQDAQLLPCIILTTLAPLEHADTTFAWHDVSLQFGIKCCFLFGRTLSPRTFLGVTIWFVISSHIISSCTNERGQMSRSTFLITLLWFLAIIRIGAESLFYALKSFGDGRQFSITMQKICFELLSFCLFSHFPGSKNNKRDTKILPDTMSMFQAKGRCVPSAHDLHMSLSAYQAIICHQG